MEGSGKIKDVELVVSAQITISGRIGVPEWWPSGNRSAVILAHDAPGSFDDPLVLRAQQELTAHGVLNIAFNFPFAQANKKRADSPAVLERSYRTAVQALLRDPAEAPSRMVFAGFGQGARVAAQMIAGGDKADGLICIGYPLHPAGKPSQQKADALFRIICPILFVQGERDANCRIDRLELLQRRIGAPSETIVIGDADHSLAPIKRSQRTQEEIGTQMMDAINAFLYKAVG